MEISYWLSRWNKGNTGWHMQQVYPHLISYWHRLQLDRGSTVLVPLCGKSLDMLWLADQGHRVVGVEVSDIAIKEFMSHSKQTFQSTSKAPFTVFEGESIQLWLGDIFKLQPGYLPPVDAIYDKAALIALPRQKRRTYAQLMQRLCSDHTQVLLNCLEYKQEEMNGPPFAVHPDELQTLYGNRFATRLLHEASLLENLSKFRQRGLSSYLTEKLYHLLPV